LQGRIGEISTFGNTEEAVLLIDAWGNKPDSWIVRGVGERTFDDSEGGWDKFSRESSTAQVDDVTGGHISGFADSSVIRNDSDEFAWHSFDGHGLGDHSLETGVLGEVLGGQRNEDCVLRDGDSCCFLDNFLTFEPDSVKVVDDRIALDGESAGVDGGVEHESWEVRGDSVVCTGEEVVHVLELGVVVSGNDVISSVPAGELFSGGEGWLDDSVMVGHNGVRFPGLVLGDGWLGNIRLDQVGDILWVLGSFDLREFVVRDVRCLRLRNGLLSDVNSFGFEVRLEWNVNSDVVGLDSGGHEVLPVVEFVDFNWFNGLADFDGHLVDEQVVSFVVDEDGQILLLELVGVAFLSETGIDA